MNEIHYEAIRNIQEYFDNLYPFRFDFKKAYEEYEAAKTYVKTIARQDEIGPMSMVMSNVVIEYTLVHMEEHNLFLAVFKFSYEHPVGGNGYTTSYRFDKDGKFLLKI
jgi:hypothetical protein